MLKNNFKFNDNRIKMLIYISVYGCIAVFLYCFFSQAHPLIVFDTDDWGYISETRSILPTFSTYNPAKVFPELLMPFCGTIAAKLVFPLTGDYIGSLTVVFAAVATLFILLYIAAFNIFIKKAFKLSYIHAAVISVIFLAFHFWIFRKAETENLFMFRSLDLNSFVNYIISSLLNAILVMILLAYSMPAKKMKNRNLIFKIVFIVTVYLAIFSNLFSSVILAVFSGSVILCLIIKLIIKKISAKEFVKNTYLHFFIILLWSVSAYFEFFGARSAAIRKEISFKAIKDTLFYFYLICVEDLGFAFFFFSIFVVFIALLIFVKSKMQCDTDRRYGYILYTGIICAAVSFVYIFVLCLNTHHWYIQREDAIFPFVFYAFVIVAASLAYICKKINKANIMLPVLALMIVLNCNTPGITFAETNAGYCSPQVCYEISTSIVQQVLEAEEKGLNETEVYVPYYNEDNWPLSINLSRRIGYSLYKHGVTDS